MDEEGKRDDAAFYRGIARQLAAAHGKANAASRTAHQYGSEFKTFIAD